MSRQPFAFVLLSSFNASRRLYIHTSRSMTTEGGMNSRSHGHAIVVGTVVCQQFRLANRVEVGFCAGRAWRCCDWEGGEPERAGE